MCLHRMECGFYRPVDNRILQGRSKVPDLLEQRGMWLD